MTLLFNIDNQRIITANTRYVVADSREYLTARFVFSGDWDGCAKTAIFAGKEGTYEVLLTNDECTVPHEVLNGRFGVSVFGISGNTRITTDTVYIAVQKSGFTEGETPADPTPTVYEQLLKAIDESGQDTEAALEKESEARAAADAGLEENKADKTELGNYYTKGEVDNSLSAVDTQLWLINEQIIGKVDTSDLTEEISARTAADTAINSTLTSHGSDISALQSSVSTAEADIESLQEDIATKADVPTITTPTSTSVTLSDNTEARFGEVATLTLSLPSDTSGDYISSVIFASGTTATSLSYPDAITMIGTDCIDGVFAPVANKRYTLIVAYDGAGLVGYVAGHEVTA